MTRIAVFLNEKTIAVLSKLAKQEYRDIRQQAAWIIEQELERRGLLVIKAQAVDGPKKEEQHVTA